MSQTWPRLMESLGWLVAEASCTRDEFRAVHHPGGDMLLDGLMSRGLIIGDKERIAASQHGIKVLEASSAK